MASTPPLKVKSIVDSSPRDALIGVCADKNAPVSVYDGLVADTALDDGFTTSVVVVPTRL